MINNDGLLWLLINICNYYDSKLNYNWAIGLLENWSVNSKYTPRVFPGQLYWNLNLQHLTVIK